MELSNKPNVRNVVEICYKKGVEYVVISPGSRNAPLNISFNEHGGFTCLSVPDERVAGFFALGISQQNQKPTIITCTSGSAALNFAPAISEAYYQKIPLLVITADRPVEWTDQGNGQTIRQRNIFANYIKKSYEIPQNPQNEQDIWYINRIISEAIDQTMHYGEPGPVHINMPFREPLYGLKNYDNTNSLKISTVVETSTKLSILALERLVETWQNSTKKLILVGMLPIKEKGLNKLLGDLVDDPSVVVLTETTANLSNPKFCPCIDRLIDSIAAEQIIDFQPNLLITIGHSVISKKVKFLLREHKAKIGWHIGEEAFHLDTFQNLTEHIPMSPTDFFMQLESNIYPTKSNYQNTWKTQDEKTSVIHNDFLRTTTWSDLKAFEHLVKALPVDSNLQMGNSSVVRYVQLFTQRSDIHFNGNRGVAGIDGSTSTATGAAFVNQRSTIMITGDIAFFYDSNAFWNRHLTDNLRVILINNGGGNIFRIIKGPSETNQLEDFFETHHTLKAEHLAKLYSLNYYQVHEEEGLKAVLPKFYAVQKNRRPAILEIITPRLENDKILKDYFNHLKLSIEEMS